MMMNGEAAGELAHVGSDELGVGEGTPGMLPGERTYMRHCE